MFSVKFQFWLLYKRLSVVSSSIHAFSDVSHIYALVKEVPYFEIIIAVWKRLKLLLKESFIREKQAVQVSLVVIVMIWNNTFGG